MISATLHSTAGAKRIGLLYSEAEIDYTLDPKWIKDIADIKSGDEVFSDGCGLISVNLAKQLSKKRRIMFRGARYTPCVFQIRSTSFFRHFNSSLTWLDA